MSRAGLIEQYRSLIFCEQLLPGRQWTEHDEYTKQFIAHSRLLKYNFRFSEFICSNSIIDLSRLNILLTYLRTYSTEQSP